MLRIHNVMKQYAGFLLKVSELEIPAGRVVGLVGHNGSGKSTFLKIISGILQADAVRIDIDGDEMPDMLSLRQRVSFCPDKPALYDWMTPKQFAEFCISARLCRESSLWPLLEEFEVPISKRIRELSFGTRSKVGISIALSRNTPYLVLDEPLLGLDMKTREAVTEKLMATTTNDADGRGLLLSTHMITDLELLVSDVMLFKAGRCVLKSSMAAVREEWRVVESDTEHSSYFHGTSGTGAVAVRHCSELSHGEAARVAKPLEVFLGLG